MGEFDSAKKRKLILNRFTQFTTKVCVFPMVHYVVILKKVAMIVEASEPSYRKTTLKIIY